MTELERIHSDLIWAKIIKTPGLLDFFESWFGINMELENCCVELVGPRKRRHLFYVYKFDMQIVEKEIDIIHKCGLYTLDTLRLTWSPPSYAGIPSIIYHGAADVIDDLTNFKIPLKETLFTMDSDEMDWNWLRDALKIKLIEMA